MPRDAAHHAPLTHRSRRAWTLIETIVSLGVLALLIAILLPALAHARTSARQALTLARLKQTFHDLDRYANAFADTLPWAPAGAWIQLSPEPPDAAGMFAVAGGYWDLAHWWPGLMHQIAPWREHFHSWIGAGPPAGDPWLRDEAPFGRGTPSFILSHTMFARPELWSPGAHDHPNLYRPVRLHDIRYPAQKVLLLDAELRHLTDLNADRDLRPMLMNDASASLRRLAHATPPPTLPFKDTRPVYDTPEGARGIDYPAP